MKFFGKLRRLTSIILALVNVAMVLALLATGYAGVFNPARHPSTEIMVLAFPLPLVINVAFLVFWLLFNYKYAIIPLVNTVCYAACLNISEFKANIPGIRIISIYFIVSVAL